MMTMRRVFSVLTAMVLTVAVDAAAQWQTNGTKLYYNGGKVGIGTDNPSEMLDVIGNAYVSGYLALRTGSRVRFTSANGGNFAEIYSPANEGVGLSPISFNVGAGEAMRIMNSGNVGIGTATPTERLHVVGNITATGSITGATVIGATYQDLAEWVPATTDMTPGTVVILNTEKNNEVMPSAGEYDVRVAGVVSKQPGLILGVEGPSKEQIATTGRVMVKVDATRAPIRVGDLLVTSSRSGRAMRSDAIEIQGRQFHQPGTIIGKALEPLASGDGEILVLLSLQ